MTPKQDLTSEAWFSPRQQCVQRIATLIRACRRTLDVCVFTITDDRIAGPLLDAHERGVAVRILTDNEKEYDAGSDIDRLRQAGVPVAVDRTANHMHHKFALFDGQKLLTGSYNWTRGAAEYNLENFIVTGEAGLLAAYQQEFDRLWQQLA